MGAVPGRSETGGRDGVVLNMRAYREHDRDRNREPADNFAYGRPSTSAWIAAAAVAFAVFILGGFIKTYHQLETLKEESRREIRDLKAVVESLRDNPPNPAATPGNLAMARPIQRPSMALPPASRASREAQGAFPQPERPSLPEIDEERPRLSYSVGRSSRREGGYGKPLAEQQDHGPFQVVSVNNTQKRLMVEGGKNIGLGEGSRLGLSRQGKWIGDLRVLEAFDTMSVCEFVHATLPPEPGDVVRMP